MSILSQRPSSVSLEDSDATPEEIQAVRDWMRSDRVPDDEAPELPDAAYHDPDFTDFFLVSREGVDLW